VIVNPFVKAWFKALPLVVGVSVARAQEADPFAPLLAPLIDRLGADLRSDDPIRIASAARKAAELHLEALAPEIVAALERAPTRDLGPLDPAELEDPPRGHLDPPPPDPRFEETGFLHRYVPGVLLDSLTQLDAAPPEKFIERTLLWTIETRLDPADPFPYFRDAFEPALVLLAQHGSEYQDLIERIMDLTARRELAPNDLRAWIAADWCATFEPKRLALTMIDLPTWSVEIDVVGYEPAIGWLRDGAWACYGRPPRPRRLPVEMLNVLDGLPRVGAKCLFDHAVPLFWRRGDPAVVDLDPRPPWDEPDEPIHRPAGDVAVAFLRGAGLMDPVFAATSTKRSLEHVWKGDGELLDFARQQKSAIETECSAILQALVKRGLIDAATAKQKSASVRFEFEDWRREEQKRAEPLPAPPE
jgi:hypothetical protein